MRLPVHAGPLELSAQPSGLDAFLHSDAFLRTGSRSDRAARLPPGAPAGALALLRGGNREPHPARLDHIFRHDVLRPDFTDALFTRLGLHPRPGADRPRGGLACRRSRLAKGGPEGRGGGESAALRLHRILRRSASESSRRLAEDRWPHFRRAHRRPSPVSLSVSLARFERPRGRGPRGVLRHRSLRPRSSRSPSAGALLRDSLEPLGFLSSSATRGHSAVREARGERTSRRGAGASGRPDLPGLRAISTGDSGLAARRLRRHHLGGPALSSLVLRPLAKGPEERPSQATLPLSRAAGCRRPGARPDLRPDLPLRPSLRARAGSAPVGRTGERLARMRGGAAAARLVPRSLSLPQREGGSPRLSAQAVAARPAPRDFSYGSPRDSSRRDRS